MAISGKLILHFNRLSSFLLFVSVACLQVLVAQERHLDFEEFIIEDGFASINCILKDKEGFMWFGGTHGLYRYDGYGFKTYFANDGDLSSLSNNNVITIFQDREGLIWIGTMRGGVNCYNPIDETFVNYKNTEAYSLFTDNYVTAITQDEDGLIWIGTFGEGIYIYDKTYRTFSKIKKDSSNSNTISNNDVFSIVAEGKKIWITTNAGVLDCYDKSEGRFFHYTYSPKSYKSSRSGQRIAKDHSGNIWISTEEEGIFMFDQNKKTFYNYRVIKGKPSISTNNITDIKIGKSGEIWATTGEGLNLINTTSNDIQTFKRDAFDTNSLTNDIAYCLFVDKDGTLWMGMGDGTVNKTVDSPFEIYQTSFSKENSLSFNVVGSLFLKDNILWVGTGGGGLDKFDLSNRTFTNYHHNANRSGSIPSNIVMSVFEDGESNLWIGNPTKSIVVLKKDGTDFFIQPKINYKGPPISVFDLADDQNGNLWIATYNQGLFSYNKLSHEYFNFQYEENKHGLVSNKLLRLLCDKFKRLWIGTLDKGIQLYDLTKKKFLTLKELGFKNPPEMKHPIKDIYEDKVGNIWIASEGKGVYRLNMKTKKITSFGSEEGFPSNSVYGIIQDHFDDFWFSTNKGLVNLKSGTQKIVTYNTKDGLPTNDYESGAIAISKEGELFFGSKKGLVAFFPENLETRNAPIDLKLTGFRLFNDKVNVHQKIEGIVPLDTSITYKKHIRLPYFLDNFDLEFASVGHPSPHSITYEYQLEGLDERWIGTSSERNFTTYSNTPPGDYTFRVRAYETTTSEAPKYAEKAIAITITPIWWQTNWAYLIYTMLFGGLIYFVYQSITNRVRLQNQLLIEKFSHEKDQELHQSKISFFTSISHELRTSLTLILAPLGELRKTKFDNNRTSKLVMTMNRNGQRLLNLVNQILDFRKIESGLGKLQVSSIDTELFFEEICIPFQQFAKEKKVTFKTDFSKIPRKCWMDIEKVEIMVYNLLSNAFKYAKTTVSIEVHTLNNEKELLIKVSDDGRGITKKNQQKVFNRFFQSEHNTIEQGTGLGLAITKNLAVLHRGSITVDSIPNSNTVFSLIFPISKEVYTKKELTLDKETKNLVNQSNELQSTSKNQNNLVEKPILLIVEDNEEMRNFLKSNFSQKYIVNIAKNGLEGLNLAYDIVPDIIISDIMMPEMNGLELCEKLKTDYRTSHIPIILLTARASNTFIIEGFDYGADDYLTKPFNIDLLSVRLNNLLESRELLRKKFKKEIILKPMDIAINNTDERFLEKLMELIEKNMSNEKYAVSTLAKDIAMSHSALYRKMKALTNQNINDFVKSMRLKRAADLIQKSDYNINEICDLTGFSNPKYFSTCFKQEYGETPTEFKKSQVLTT